jgi:hypothetical protein
MPKVATETEATAPMAVRTDIGRTYDRSVKIQDVGGATPENPHPKAAFVNPDPKSIHQFDLTSK